MYVLKYAIVQKTLPITLTILVASLARTAILAHYGRQNQYRLSETFLGKKTNGAPTKGHTHAFYIPLDSDCNNYLDEVLIISHLGFTDKEICAVKSVKELHSIHHDIHTSVTFSNHINYDLITRGGQKWISATPFVLSRHTKIRNGTVLDSPASQVKLEISRRYPNYKVKKIQVADRRLPMRITNHLPDDFERTRKNTERSMAAYEIIVEFDDFVPGPLLLGHNCHFGLGRLIPY